MITVPAGTTPNLANEGRVRLTEWDCALAFIMQTDRNTSCMRRFFISVIFDPEFLLEVSDFGCFLPQNWLNDLTITG